MRARKFKIYRLILVGLLILVPATGIKYGWYHLFPKHFAEVETGQLYRSGYCEPRPLENVLREHHIKTVLSLLNEEPNSKEEQNEQSVIHKTGTTLVHIGMPGNGCGTFDDLDHAAALMADPNNRPILVHCSGGVNRTGAAYMAYRMRYCDWNFDQAFAEAVRYGHDPQATPKMREHMMKYYQERVVSSRPAK